MLCIEEESRKYWANEIRESNALRSIIQEGEKYHIKGARLLELNNPKLYRLAKYFFTKAKSFYEKYLEVGKLHGNYEPLQRCNDALKFLESKCNSSA